MTIPHLMNCPHSDSGWCLDCVKEMHDEGERRYRDYLAYLPLAYATGEWLDGQINTKEYAATAASVLGNKSPHSHFGPLLAELASFESNADPGPGRELESVSIQLWCDGSGNLLVQTSATTEKPGMERMMNRVFNTEVAISFNDLNELYKMLKNHDLLKPKHPEAQKG